jgi:hypothetical protein
MHRYKSLTGFSIYAFGIRYVLCTRYALRGMKGFISYRIAKQYTDKKLPEEEK